jgi:CRP/FNR family transcriptional regulator
MPFDRIEQLARDDAAFQHRLHRCLAREHTRQRSLMVLLGTLRADQRLASFLLDLSQRYRDRGHSPSELVLRMTRAEIGSYLGAKLETVSRVLSRMQQQRIVRIDGRVVRVLDRGALERLAGPSA